MKTSVNCVWVGFYASCLSSLVSLILSLSLFFFHSHLSTLYVDLNYVLPLVIRTALARFPAKGLAVIPVSPFVCEYLFSSCVCVWIPRRDYRCNQNENPPFSSLIFMVILRFVEKWDWKEDLNKYTAFRFVIFLIFLYF